MRSPGRVRPVGLPDERPKGADVDHLDAIRKYVAAVIAANEGFGEDLARRARAKEAEGFILTQPGLDW